MHLSCVHKTMSLLPLKEEEISRSVCNFIVWYLSRYIPIITIFKTSGFKLVYIFGTVLSSYT